MVKKILEDVESTNVEDRENDLNKDEDVVMEVKKDL